MVKEQWIIILCVWMIPAVNLIVFSTVTNYSFKHVGNCFVSIGCILSSYLLYYIPSYIHTKKSFLLLLCIPMAYTYLH